MTNSEKKEIHKQMLESGIGRRYLDTSQSTLGKQGEQVVERIKQGEMQDAIEAGAGITFYGADSYDFAVLTMRSLLLADLTVQVVTLAGLARSLDNWEFAEKLAGQDCLLVTKFCDDGMKENPLSGYQRFQLEDLLQDRFDDGKPVFIQTTHKLETYKDWWSPNVINQLKQRNDVMEIKKL